MNSKVIKILIGLLFIGVAYFLFLRSPHDKKGNKAPNFKPELISGESFELNDLRGDYVLLDFWGSWCGPCRRDNPSLVKLYDEFSEKTSADGKAFHIVTVALEKNDRSWKKAADRDGFKWKHQIVQMSKAVMLSPVAQKYSVSDIPAKFLISPDGEIIGVNQSYEELRSILSQNL